MRPHHSSMIKLELIPFQHYLASDLCSIHHHSPLNSKKNHSSRLLEVPQMAIHKLTFFLLKLITQENIKNHIMLRLESYRRMSPTLLPLYISPNRRKLVGYDKQCTYFVLFSAFTLSLNVCTLHIKTKYAKSRYSYVFSYFLSLLKCHLYS